MHQVDVEISVVVVVEQRDAAADHLAEVELTRHSVDVLKIKTGRDGRVDKRLGEAGLPRRPRLRRRLPHGGIPAGTAANRDRRQ